LLGDFKDVTVSNTSIFEDLKTQVAITALGKAGYGTSCSVNLGWIGDITHCPFTLWGTAGTIFVEPMFEYFEEIHGPRNPVRRWINTSRTLVRFVSGFAAKTIGRTHYHLLQNYTKSLREDTRPVVDVQDGLKVMESIHQIGNAIKRNE
jgi:hypothetical protein